MFFDTEPPHSWSFHHNGVSRNLDDSMEEPRPRPARPKFHSFDALRPGLFAPRPFQQQRERRTSDGSGCYTSEEDAHASDARSQASSTGSSGESEYKPNAGKERIIPITLERDDEETTVTPSPPLRPARKPSRKDTVDGSNATMQNISEERQPGEEVNGGEESERDIRAQSCPVNAPLPPLNVNAAMTAQQRSASQPPQQSSPYGKPNYLNSSPKPFSPGAKPFHPASFGVFRPVSRRPSQQETESVSIPVQVELSESIPAEAGRTTEEPAPRLPPKVAPKPKNNEVPSPPPVKTARQIALEKILAVHQEVDPLTQQLESFDGTRGDKEYLYLDEMLTRQLIRLDDVEANGDVDVRNSRKEAIKRIQDSLSALEKKCSKNQASVKNEKTEVADGASDAAAQIASSSTEPEKSTARMDLNLSAGLAHAEPGVANGASRTENGHAALENGGSKGDHPAADAAGGDGSTGDGGQR